MNESWQSLREACALTIAFTLRSLQIVRNVNCVTTKKGISITMCWSARYSQTLEPRMPKQFRNNIDHVKAKSECRANRMQQDLQRACVRCCKVFLDDLELFSKRNFPTTAMGSVLGRQMPYASSDQQHQQQEKHRGEHIVAYVDGSAFNPTDMRRTRVGLAVYFWKDRV